MWFCSLRPVNLNGFDTTGLTAFNRMNSDLWVHQHSESCRSRTPVLISDQVQTGCCCDWLGRQASWITASSYKMKRPEVTVQLKPATRQIIKSLKSRLCPTLLSLASLRLLGRGFECFLADEEDLRETPSRRPPKVTLHLIGQHKAWSHWTLCKSLNPSASHWSDGEPLIQSEVWAARWVGCHHLVPFVRTIDQRWLSGRLAAPGDLDRIGRWHQAPHHPVFPLLLLPLILITCVFVWSSLEWL